MIFKKLKEAESRQTKNYKAGVGFERRVMSFLREHGWHCMRRYGSWSENTEFGKVSTDLTAYHFGVYLIISCKYSSYKNTVPFDDEYFENMVKYAERFGAIPVFAGINENRKTYFVDLRTMQELDVSIFDTVKNLESVTQVISKLRVFKHLDKDKTQIERLIEEAWQTIDLCNQMIYESANVKTKARWATIKASVIVALNRVLWRAGQVDTKDEITSLVEKAEQMMKEEESEEIIESQTEERTA